MKQVSQLRRKFLFIVLRDIHVERQIASSKRYCYTVISKLNLTARGNVPRIAMRLILTDVTTTSAVLIFRVKVSCIYVAIVAQ